MLWLVIFSGQLAADGVTRNSSATDKPLRSKGCRGQNRSTHVGITDTASDNVKGLQRDPAGHVSTAFAPKENVSATLVQVYPYDQFMSCFRQAQDHAS